MNESNTMATVSLSSGVAVWVLFFVSLCLGFIPLLGMLNLLLFPLTIVLAFVGVVTGLLGYRQSRVNGIGGSSSMIGALLCLAWMVLEGVMVAFGIGMLALVALSGGFN